jgi:hypothetical protein
MSLHFTRQRISWVLVCAIFVFGVLFLIVSQNSTAQQSKKQLEYEKAYKVYTQKCLTCHVSVADPEKPGRTQDDWHLVVNVMHGYGLGLSQQESEMIIDLLYDLRKGMEREAG